jgi:hypothetical protein
MRIMASWKTGMDLLNYLMANGQNLEKRPERNSIVFFSGSAAEQNTLEGQGQPNLRAFSTHRQAWELSI